MGIASAGILAVSVAMSFAFGSSFGRTVLESFAYGAAFGLADIPRRGYPGRSAIVVSNSIANRKWGAVTLLAKSFGYCLRWERLAARNVLPFTVSAMVNPSETTLSICSKLWAKGNLLHDGRFLVRERMATSQDRSPSPTLWVAVVQRLQNLRLNPFHCKPRRRQHLPRGTKCLWF